jgi:hypothetical protein
MGLATGTFRLTVTKGAGVNVLRGDLDLAYVGVPSFAVAANVYVNEDTITFQLVTRGIGGEHYAQRGGGCRCTVCGYGGAWQDPGTIDLAPG